jgi:murein DD-endopeptidase MepM/ murein hydrolase activator NlpD
VGRVPSSSGKRINGRWEQMNKTTLMSGASLSSRFGSLFTSRDCIPHNGYRRATFRTTHGLIAGIAGVVSCMMAGGVAHAAEGAAAVAAVHAAATGSAFDAAADSATTAAADTRADVQFRSLFQTWKKLDTFDQGGAIAIPSVQPVEHLAFTSNFGIRSDPFRGTAKMHAGVDIPGPVGTPVYATADGYVDRAERAGGYGNLVEIDHGKGIQTRYGHLSKILVPDHTRVHRGQLIALIGSTGRSTGPHLHYEVRIDGHAVNPVPFLQTADYLLAAQDRSVHTIPVGVGPAADDAAD